MRHALILATAAAIAMTGGAALAAGPKAKTSATAAAPQRPIPYSQMDAYMKASPRKRATYDWWSSAAAPAAPGSAADASASGAAATDPAADATAGASVNPAPAPADPAAAGMSNTPPVDSAPSASGGAAAGAGTDATAPPAPEAAK